MPQPGKRSCTPSTSTANCICVRSAAACSWVPMRRPTRCGRNMKRRGRFGHELLTPDIDRIAPSLEIAFTHFPALSARRHQEDRQRPLHRLARWQPARGTSTRTVWILVCVWRHGGIQPGRRRRPRARELDDPRGPWIRRVGHGCGPLRQLGQQGLYQCKGARKLCAPILDPISERRAPRSATC